MTSSYQNHSKSGFHFSQKHFILISLITLLFLVAGTLLNMLSKRNIFNKTSIFYRHTSIENLADLTATSLELLLDQVIDHPAGKSGDSRLIIQAFDMIFSQHRLKENIQEICVLIDYGDSVYAIDTGSDLYNYFSAEALPNPAVQTRHHRAIRTYQDNIEELINYQDITGYVDDLPSYHVLIPLMYKGDFSAALYMNIALDYTGILDEIQLSYSTVSMLFTALIILGLLSMFYLSSYMINEREQALHQLFEKQQQQLKTNVELQKEQHFAQRIYHTHHKAEKIMGLIKEDLRTLPQGFQDEKLQRVMKFSSYIQRVIYDMKSYNPPITTIRNPAFHSNINEIITFLVDTIFTRMISTNNGSRFSCTLDPAFPIVHINEYVIWEILEPLIHNSIIHSNVESPLIEIMSGFDPETQQAYIRIADNGQGFSPEFLEYNESGIQKLFLEHISSYSNRENSGYGAYIAYQMCLRCGWTISAKNKSFEKGAVIEIGVNV